MEDINTSYGLSDFFSECPPVGDAPPENIFEDQNLNNLMQEASASHEVLDPNESAVSGAESTGSNLDSSYGLPNLFQQVTPNDNPPDDLFEVGVPRTEENSMPIGPSRANLSELLTPGAPDTLDEIFGSLMDPAEEQHTDQTSTNLDIDAADSSGIMTYPCPAPTFLSGRVNDPMLRAGDFNQSISHSPVKNELAPFQGAGLTFGKLEPSSAVIEAVAALINQEPSSNVGDFTRLFSPREATRMQTDSVPSTAAQAVAQPGSPHAHGHPRHASTNSVPSTALQVVSPPASRNLHGHTRRDSSTDTLPSTSSKAVQPKGSPYSRRPSRRNSMTESVPPSPSQAVGQEGSPYPRRNPRRNSKSRYALPAQNVNPTAASQTPQKFRNASSSPNLMKPSKTPSDPMKVSQPPDDGQGAFAGSLASFTPPLALFLDNQSNSPIAGRNISRCSLCSTLRFLPRSSTDSNAGLCMTCESVAARE